jgi:hypothetical protein
MSGMNPSSPTPLSLRPVFSSPSSKNSAIQLDAGAVSESWGDDGWANVAVDGFSASSQTPAKPHIHPNGIVISQRDDAATFIRGGDPKTASLESHLSRDDDGQASLIVQQGKLPDQQTEVRIPLGNASNADEAFFSGSFGKDGSTDVRLSSSVTVRPDDFRHGVSVQLGSGDNSLDYLVADGKISVSHPRQVSFNI